MLLFELLLLVESSDVLLPIHNDCLVEIALFMPMHCVNVLSWLHKVAVNIELGVCVCIRLYLKHLLTVYYCRVLIAAHVLDQQVLPVKLVWIKSSFLLRFVIALRSSLLKPTKNHHQHFLLHRVHD